MSHGAALRITGARRVGDREDGAPLRVPRRRASDGLCRQHGKARHKYGTTTGFMRHSLIASIWKIKNWIWPGVELNHRHADFQSANGGPGCLLINHLQRLPALTPGPPRHNYGTPNL